jgi:alpha-D-ribose 1-methylphosphonate 5-triphosphate synthase subunit PhnG
VNTTLSADERAELLAAAHHDELVPLAERLFTDGVLSELTVVKPPQVGLVLLQVREPVAEERFYLGEVLVTDCTVELHGHAGWSMRGGDDRAASLAAAILDAVVASGDENAPRVEALCQAVAERRAGEHAAEWDEIAATTVQFEELP